MVLGIGVDVVEIPRFSKVLDRWGDRFTRRVLTATEISICEKKSSRVLSIAARFAAKEALYKALPASQQPGISWHHMQVTNNATGTPVVEKFGPLEKILRNRTVHISLSHTHTTAVAMVVIEG